MGWGGVLTVESQLLGTGQQEKHAYKPMPVQRLREANKRNCSDFFSSLALKFVSFPSKNYFILCYYSCVQINCEFFWC